MEYKNFIDHVLIEAAKIANQYFGKVSSTVKPDDQNQVLTEADIKVGKFIVEQIKRNFPKDNNIY